MPARSLVIQLQPGVKQAILPDHRKMVPGVQYVVDWETFDKISVGARQNVINVVSVQSDSDTTDFYPAQSSNSGSGVDFFNILTTPYNNLSDLETALAGFAAQGSSGQSLVGLTDDDAFYSGSTSGLRSLTGPAGERYLLVQLWDSDISAGDVIIWVDENNATVSDDNSWLAQQYVVRVDGQGTEYVVPTVLSWEYGPYGPNANAFLTGGFAGIALASASGGQWFWIQSEGFCPKVSVGSNTVAAGNALSPDRNTNGDAKAQPATPTVVDSSGVVTGSALANATFGTALTSSTSGTPGFVQADLRSTQKVKKPYVRLLNKN